MKKTKTFGLFVSAFSVIFIFVVILVGSILICINKFIDIPGMVWFWRGLKISGVVAFIGAVLIVRSTKRFKETKLSFWIGKHFSKLLLGYILAVLMIGSINSQPIWDADMVSEVLSLQWTIFGLSLTIFLVWNVLMVEFLKGKRPKVSESSSLYQKFTLALEKERTLKKLIRLSIPLSCSLSIYSCCCCLRQ